MKIEHAEPAVTAALAREHGLSDAEYEKILAALGRADDRPSRLMRPIRVGSSPNARSSVPPLPTAQHPDGLAGAEASPSA
jgi:hypothetical protein